MQTACTPNKPFPGSPPLESRTRADSSSDSTRHTTSLRVTHVDSIKQDNRGETEASQPGRPPQGALFMRLFALNAQEDNLPVLNTQTHNRAQAALLADPAVCPRTSIAKSGCWCPVCKVIMVPMSVHHLWPCVGAEVAVVPQLDDDDVQIMWAERSAPGSGGVFQLLACRVNPILLLVLCSLFPVANFASLRTRLHASAQCQPVIKGVFCVPQDEGSGSQAYRNNRHLMLCKIVR